jgi:hypothetical protein
VPDNIPHDVTNLESDNELTAPISEGIQEVLVAADITFEPKERVVLAEEIVEKFISPVMIQRAAGATSQVTVTMNPAGGISGAHSIKARNALVNLKYAVTALPASLPGLASFYESTE